MKNQHKKIKGYRDLLQSEINLMNRIKEHGEKTNTLINELETLRNDDMTLTQDSLDETLRCIEISKEKLQTGQMWLTRAVALPESF